MTEVTVSASSSSVEDDSPDLGPSFPAKRCYRQRAHCNPWSDHSLDYPVRPELFDWENLYSDKTIADPNVRIVDVGCGYGGLLYSLGAQFPETRSLGLELRLKVVDFVQDKIKALRATASFPGEFGNIACLRTNAMRFLPNFFSKGQLQRMFFLYPDPHFKRVKHKWRIISPTLLDVYAYVLAPGGFLYTTTDVLDLAIWMADCLSKHPLFKLSYYAQFAPSADKSSLVLQKKCDDLNLDKERCLYNEKPVKAMPARDAVVDVIKKCITDESKKATREGRKTTLLVFERVNDPV